MCVSGLGCGVPAPDRDQHPLLDRASPQRAPAVAGPGPHTGATIKYFLAPENIFFPFYLNSINTWFVADGLPFSAVQLHELEYK